MIPVVDAMSDPHLFGRWFNAPSWATWRAVLRAAYALPMSDDDLDLFRAVAGNRAPPTRPVKELWAIAGRRSGKDSVASLIAAHTAAMMDFRPRLRPGERASILCLAVDRAQARIVHRYVRGYFDQIPLLKPLVVTDSDEVLELNNGNEIIVATNSFRAIRGKTYAAAILDEAAFWRDDNFANPDKEVYEAILPGFATLDDSALLVGITTPYMRAGLAYDKWEQHFGKDDDDVLVVYGPSTAFNPSLPQAIIDRALARDPERGKSEWLAQWRDLESAFLPLELIQSAVEPGLAARPPVAQHSYTAFTDPAGGAGSDSFTAAICHAESGVAVLDALYERAPPFSPQATVAEIASLLRQYGIHRATGDRYAGDWPAEAFRDHGVTYEPSELTRSEIYAEAIPLFTSGRVRLLDNRRVVDQFAGLRRRVQPGGREQIDHGPNAHDDLCNSAAGALVMVGTDPLAVWRRLADNERGIEPPPPRDDGDDTDTEFSPLVAGPGQVLVDMPRHLNVALDTGIYPLRPGRQAVPPEVAQHWIVRRFVISEEPDHAA